MKSLLATTLVMVWICIFPMRGAQAQDASPRGPEGPDPFGQSQLSEPIVSGTSLGGGVLLTVRGFVDVGLIHITQTGPRVSGGDLSWAFGNSQFTFFSENSTFSINEVDLSLEAQKNSGGVVYGARISIDYYPSRDSEAYTIPGSDREFDVDEAFTYAEFPNAWSTRIVLGRAPGFVTLEQEEADSPDLRLIGHTYVFQAGGGYPVGLQVITWPTARFSARLGIANGGVGAYSFFPGDESTLNRPVARDADSKSSADKVEDFTLYGAVEWLPIDRPAEGGTLLLGVAAAHNSGLTFNSDTGETEPYDFRNLYLSYRLGSIELRTEYATLEAFYELSLGKFDATMWYVLVSLYLGQDHLVTLRAEQIAFTTGLDPGNEGEADKLGITYRLRLADAVALKFEALREVQSPQFSNPTLNEDLTTNVLATSWVYAF